MLDQFDEPKDRTVDTMSLTAYSHRIGCELLTKTSIITSVTMSKAQINLASALSYLYDSYRRIIQFFREVSDEDVASYITLEGEQHGC